MSKKTIESKIITRTAVVDGQTGELLQTQEHEQSATKVIRSQEPSYIKLYIEDMLYMKDMPKALSTLTYELARRATYANKEDGMCIALPKYVKQQICKACGWTDLRSLNNALTKLLNGHIIQRLGGKGSGMYQLSPYLFGKGDWKYIENIRMQWDYNLIKGKTFSTAFTYNNPDDTTDSQVNEDENWVHEISYEESGIPEDELQDAVGYSRKE